MTTMVDVGSMMAGNQKYECKLPKNPGITPPGCNLVFVTPKNPGIVPSPQVDEFVRTLPKKDEKPEVKPEPQNSKTGKKCGVALATVLYSGLGQAVNGQWGKALGLCLLESAATVTGFCLGGPLGALLGAWAVKGYSIYDAVKNV